MNVQNLYSRSMVSVEVSNLVGRTEIGEILHVKTTTVGNWYERRAYIGFPETVARLSMGPIWDLSEVLAWWKSWTPKHQHPKVGYLDEPNRN